MDARNQKERLEQELRFLKESFEAEVISKEEFEKGKDRIEKKLKELGTSGNAGIMQDESRQANAESVNESKSQGAEKDNVIIREGSKIKLKVVNENQEHAEEMHSQMPVTPEPPHEHETRQQDDFYISDESKQKGKFLKYVLIAIIFLGVFGISYYILKNNSGNPNPNSSSHQITLQITECEIDSDCTKDGNNGKCANSGTKDAKCEYEASQNSKLNLIILNDDKECFNCNATRVINILQGWFGKLLVQEINYDSPEGGELIKQYGIKTLPAFILDPEIENSIQFGTIQQVFVKKEDAYLMTDNAAGSTYYFKRESKDNKLDF